MADEQQGGLDFYPEIALGDDGAVHVVTRGGGDTTSGFEIRYQRRAPGGGWDAAVVVGAPVERNYVVGVFAVGARVVVAHSRLVENVYSVMDLYDLASGTAEAIGSTPDGWLRADNDFRFASSGSAVLLASGEPGPSSAFHVAFAGDAGGDLVAQWQASHVEHEGGEPRRGGPATHVDDTGSIHVVYGAMETLHYARYAADGSLALADTLVMGGLGMWHLSHGNGAVVASADGARVLAIGLQNLDGDQTADDSDVLWAESVDGGATFSDAMPVGVTSNGGEGRQRPRLERLGDTVLLVHNDGDAIALATAAWEDEPPNATTTGASGDETSDPDDGTTAGSTGATAGSGSGVETSGGSTPGLDPTTPFPPSGRGSDGGCGCVAAQPAGDGSLLALLPLLLCRRRSRSRVVSGRAAGVCRGAWAILVAAIASGCFSDEGTNGDGDDSSGSGTSQTGSTTSSGSGSDSSTTESGGETTLASTSTSESTGAPSAMRQRIEIDTGSVTQPLDDVPILVRLTPDRVDYAGMQPDGSDLRMWNDADEQIAFEVERWDPGAESVLWVRVPAIRPGQPAAIELGYGDLGAAAPPNPSEVWANGYLGVWHLAGSTADSTAYGFDLAPMGAPPADIEGVFGPAVRFEVDDDVLAVDDDALLDLSMQLTVEAWVMPTDIDPGAGHAFVLRKSTAYRLAAVHQTAGTPACMLHLANNTDVRVEAAVPLTVGEWSFMSATLGESVVSLHVDDAPPVSADVPGELDVNGSPLTVGGAPWLGAVDEVRISDVQRTPDWIRFQYRSMTDQLLTFHEPEPG